MQHDIVETSFVDDVAIPIVAHASDLARKTGQIASCAYTVFKLYGMTLNFKPNKSEAIVGFFGVGSTVAKQALAADENLIPITAGEDCHLRVVRGYQHVGTCTSVSHNMCEEVTKRCGMMRSESSRLCKAVLRVPSVPVPKKIKVVQTYVLSKGTFQCGTWPMLPDVQYKRFHSCILSIYRNASGNYYKSGQEGHEMCDVASMFNDDDIIYEYNFMCPRTILRLSRLSLFMRILIKAPPYLLQLATDQSCFKKGWAASLMADFKWLSCFDDFSECSRWNFQQWKVHLGTEPKSMAKLIKKVCKSPFANIHAQWAVSPVLQIFAQPIVCDSCGKVSKSLQAHSVHSFRAHGIKCKLRKYVPHTHCLICLREFWTRERCLNHVRYRSQVCRFNSILRGPILDDVEADALDQKCLKHNRQLHASGRRRHAVDRPSIILQGPLLPIILMEGQASAHHSLGVGHRHC